METIKNVLTGLAVFGAIALVVFVWVGIPLIFFSYDTAQGLAVTTVGAVWIFTPVVGIILVVLSWIGESIRNK